MSRGGVRLVGSRLVECRTRMCRKRRGGTGLPWLRILCHFFIHVLPCAFVAPLPKLQRCVSGPFPNCCQGREFQYVVTGVLRWLIPAPRLSIVGQAVGRRVWPGCSLAGGPSHRSAACRPLRPVFCCARRSSCQVCWPALGWLSRGWDTSCTLATDAHSSLRRIPQVSRGSGVMLSGRAREGAVDDLDATSAVGRTGAPPFTPARSAGEWRRFLAVPFGAFWADAAGRLCATLAGAIARLACRGLLPDDCGGSLLARQGLMCDSGAGFLSPPAHWRCSCVRPGCIGDHGKRHPEPWKQPVTGGPVLSPGGGLLPSRVAPQLKPQV